MSPLLFDLAVKILAIMVRENDEIKGVKHTYFETKLSLLANDILLFLQSPEESLEALHKVLNRYSSVSGYMINDKSL